MRNKRFSHRPGKRILNTLSGHYKHASMAEHMVLPLAGAGISGIATLMNVAKTKGDVREKLKRLIRNAALGAVIGGGLEAGRVGLKGLTKNIVEDSPVYGDPIADGHFVRYE